MPFGAAAFFYRQMVQRSDERPAGDHANSLQSARRQQPPAADADADDVLDAAAVDDVPEPLSYA